jgi:hypothetical protein
MNLRTTLLSALLAMVLAFDALPSTNPDGSGPKTVILVVDDLLLPEIQSEINRLQADLVNEGYAAKIKPWNCATQGNGDLWGYLRSEFGTAGQALKGAILIGWLPVAKNNFTLEPTDLVYWKLTGNYGDTSNDYSTVVPDIWVSRMWPSGPSDDVTLLKRALQANHDARTGAARLPHGSYFSEVAYPSSADDTSSLAALLDVWPTSEIPPIPMINVFQKGGDCFQEESHGGPGAYNIDRLDGDFPISWDLLHDAIVQMRSVVSCSCASGALGGVVNNQLFTRGGGNVLSIGASETTYSRQIWITHDASYGPGGPAFRSKLANGMPWGDALLEAWPFQDPYRMMFYGDLSIRAKASPPNQMPVVNSMTSDQWTGASPLTVNFSASASDPDGSIATYEWFPLGHCLGRVDPSASGPSSTASFTYTAAHRYLARVEVADNYKARAYKEIEIRVAPPSGTPFRVNCGRQQYALRPTPWYQPDYDYVDSRGQLWLHDQAYASGTWGGVGTPGITSDWQWDNTGNVGGTYGSQADRNALFHQFVADNARDGVGVIYYVPCANGTYTVNLGFADMVAWTAGQRLADVFINDAQVLTAFDIYQEFGPKTAAFKSFRTTVANGLLKIQLKTNPASGSTIPGASQAYSSAILNCFELLPDGGGTTPATYALQVASGSGSGSYQAGTLVTISANPAPSGQVFNQWAGASVADASASTTTLTMPAAATTVTATYKSAGNGGGGLLQGGFETPNAGTAGLFYSFLEMPAGSAWTFASGGGITANGSGFTSGNPNAPEGVQAAYLQGSGAFSQSVSLPSGSYQVSFRAAQRANWQASWQVVRVSVDGQGLGDFRPSGGVYETCSTPSITLASGTHLLQFAGLNPNGGDNTAFLDDVQLKAGAGGGGVDPSLLSYWKLDDGGGTVAADSGSFGQAGTLVNGPSWTAGKIGGGLSLNGVDEYVVLGSGGPVQVGAGASFTIGVWFRTTDNYGTIFSARNSAEGGAVIDLTVGYDGADNSLGRLKALVRQDNGTGGYARVTGGLVNDGAWHHAALTRNAGGMIELFLDGVSQGTSVGSESGGAISTDLRTLGCERRWVQDAFGTADQRYLNGSLDDVRIYSRALSAAEIVNLSK